MNEPNPRGQGLASPEYSVMVLLVDDQPIIGEAVRRLLAGQPDIDFHYCSDPEKALFYAEEIRPTVILQDLVLPGIDGLELVRQYRASSLLRDVPIIVLSTRDEAATKRDSFLAGAHDYLVKLPDPIEVIARIRHHSRAYVNQQQRDDAYRALRESQQKLMETNLELQRLSMQDGLTGLSNRRHFNAYLEIEWARAMREQQPLSLLMVDVDDFKAYNDGYGHLAGDEVLKQVADAIRVKAQRGTDLPARFGGEEFAVVLPQTSPDGVRRQGQLLCDAIAALQLPHAGSTVTQCITVSVGCATRIPQRNEISSVLIDAADFALYDAKRGGKNRVSDRTRDPASR